VKPAELSFLLDIFRPRVTFVALLWNDVNISRKDDRVAIRALAFPSWQVDRSRLVDILAILP